MQGGDRFLDKDMETGNVNGFRRLKVIKNRMTLKNTTDPSLHIQTWKSSLPDQESFLKKMSLRFLKVSQAKNFLSTQYNTLHLTLLSTTYFIGMKIVIEI